MMFYNIGKCTNPTSRIESVFAIAENDGYKDIDSLREWTICSGPAGSKAKFTFLKNSLLKEEDREKPSIAPSLRKEPQMQTGRNLSPTAKISAS